MPRIPHEYEPKKLCMPRECLDNNETSSNSFIIIKVVPKQTNIFICLDMQMAKSDKLGVAPVSSNFNLVDFSRLPT
jgi:hypothetical protein